MAPSCSQASEGLGSKHAEAHSLKRPGRAGQKRAIRGQRATQDMKRMEYGVPVSGRPLWFPLRRTGVAIPYQGPYKYARRMLSTLGTSNSRTCNAIRRCWDAALLGLYVLYGVRSTSTNESRVRGNTALTGSKDDAAAILYSSQAPPLPWWIGLCFNGTAEGRHTSVGTRTHANTADESTAGKHCLFMAETSSRAYR
ncbi:hypothetical protein J3F84DRAFT_317927 [Trichoderma pleuroticola]